MQVWHSDDPKRKLAWTLERVDMGRGWVGVNTMRPNPVMAEALEQGLIPSLRGYAELRREVVFESGKHRGRLDLGLRRSPKQADALVEIKNVTLLDGSTLRFPDARSERGRKHLELLIGAVREGKRAVMLFAVNRPEGVRFAAAGDIDPAYADKLCEARDAGVEVLVIRMVHRSDSILVGGSVPVVLDCGDR